MNRTINLRTITGLDVIREYDKPDHTWLPMIDHVHRVFPSREEYGEVNIGWNAGILGDDRPYFVECWATDGITMVTIFVSTKGIENVPLTKVEALFQQTGYYTPKENAYAPEMKKFIDGNGNEFYAINITVGDEYETYIDGANIFPFSTLNEYNTRKTP